jgi:hypothetical protein
MRFRIGPLCAALALGSSAACTDQLTEPTESLGPSYAVLDGAHSGNAHFFFLPPMVPAPAHSGTFDGGQSPVVTVCVLSGNSCGATVASFSGSQVQVQIADEAYKVIWKTKGAGLNSEVLHRIQVTVGGVVLGYADVWILNNGSTIKVVDQGQTVSTITGGTLTIRFRIETQPSTTGTWNNQDYVTYTQADWGDPLANGGALLTAKWSTVFGSSPLNVGSQFPTWPALLFTSAAAVHAFLPQLGPPGPIQGRFTDPTTTNGGVFAGETTALLLNAIFSSAGHTPAPGGTTFGDLMMCGLTTDLRFNGVLIRDFLLTATTAMQNGWAPYMSLAEVAQIAAQLNAAFANGIPSQFAQDHLVVGACPGAWKQGDLTSYGQDQWGTIGDPAAIVLLNGFDFLYPGALEVGLVGNAGYSMLFTSAADVINYLPTCGFPASLVHDYVNPTSTESGCLGGVVSALQLDVDFSDTGRLPGTSGIRFGDLRICGVNDRAAVEGETVRSLLARANQMLGGAVPDYGGPYDAGELYFLVNDVGQAFVGGAPSYFARAHLFSGACP